MECTLADSESIIYNLKLAFQYFSKSRKSTDRPLRNFKYFPQLSLKENVKFSDILVNKEVSNWQFLIIGLKYQDSKNRFLDLKRVTWSFVWDFQLEAKKYNIKRCYEMSIFLLAKKLQKKKNFFKNPILDYFNLTTILFISCSWIKNLEINMGQWGFS